MLATDVQFRFYLIDNKESIGIGIDERSRNGEISPLTADNPVFLKAGAQHTVPEFRMFLCTGCGGHREIQVGAVDGDGVPPHVEETGSRLNQITILICADGPGPFFPPCIGINRSIIGNGHTVNPLLHVLFCTAPRVAEPRSGVVGQFIC